MNILMISHVYPGAGTPETFTPVVHYFTREWVKMGHNVIVVNISTYFPWICYHLPSFVKSWLTNRFQTVLPDRPLNKAIDFEYEGVSVIRIPVFKRRPSMVVKYEKQDEQLKYILAKLEERDFTPDVVAGHWLNPIYLVAKLKEHYHCRSSLVLHGMGEMERYPDFEHLANAIDIWGLRSQRMIPEFQQRLGKNRRFFICASGIPSSIINENADLRRWNDDYIYVGFLLDRKYPEVPMKVLREEYQGEHFSYTIVGGGVKEKELHEIHVQMGRDERIRIVGRRSRPEVVNYMDKTDCFIMISRNEVFGLVYLEAMARGCIVVASRGEGMTGIIEDGVNGFLCNSGDSKELAEVIRRIRRLSVEEKVAIRMRGIKTASLYTDSRCALRYLEAVTDTKESTAG